MDGIVAHEAISLESFFTSFCVVHVAQVQTYVIVSSTQKLYGKLDPFEGFERVFHEIKVAIS